MEKECVKADLYTRNLPELEANRGAAERYRRHCRIYFREQKPRLNEGAGLWLDEKGLVLMNANIRQPLYLSNSMLTRRLRGKSLLARACGAGEGQSVLDAFAGFGLDSLTLSHAGWEVTAVEQNPLVWLMLCDYSERLGLQLEARCGDARQAMGEPGKEWDVVYLDPMFPVRRKKALPNLGLQYLQSLCGEVQVDLNQFLELAQTCARRRVVVKRRRTDPVLGKPAHQLKGQSVRFDVYL